MNDGTKTYKDLPLHMRETSSGGRSKPHGCNKDKARVWLLAHTVVAGHTGNICLILYHRSLVELAGVTVHDVAEANIYRGVHDGSHGVAALLRRRRYAAVVGEVTGARRHVLGQRRPALGDWRRRRRHVVAGDERDLWEIRRARQDSWQREVRDSADNLADTTNNTIKQTHRLQNLIAAGRRCRSRSGLDCSSVTVCHGWRHHGEGDEQ